MPFYHKRLRLGAAGLLLAGTSLLLRAAPAPALARPAFVPPPSSQTVSYAAGHARYLNAPRTVELTQSVTFNQDDAFLKTASATVTFDDQQRALNAKSATAVHLYDTLDDLTGTQGFVDFTRHLATLTGDIVLVVRPAANPPKSSLRSQFKDAATLTCAKMTYDYQQKRGHVPGALTIRQKDRVLTADEGEYDARAQTVTLRGNVHGHNGDVDIHASLATMGLKEGSEFIDLPGPSIHGHFNVPPDADTIPTPPAAASKPAAPASSVSANAPAPAAPPHL